MLKVFIADVTSVSISQNVLIRPRGALWSRKHCESFIATALVTYFSASFFADAAKFAHEWKVSRVADCSASPGGAPSVCSV